MGTATGNPLISIVTPVYNTPARVLKECINSVRRQTYTNWELCLVDDNSPNEECRKIIEKYARKDSRIKFAFREVNGGIVAASNNALSLATGEYVGLLDHDDVLEPDAIELVMQVFGSDSQIDYVYTDEDLLDESGRLYAPFRKPDWSPERFRNQMYVCHFSVIRKSLLDQVNGFRDGFDGSQDYDLILRISEHARKIYHIPIILYHWRVSTESVASNPYAKPYAYDAGERAIQDHLDRLCISATVLRRHDLPGNYEVVRCPTYSKEVEVVITGSSREVDYWGTKVNSFDLTKWSISNHSTYRNLNVRELNTNEQTECTIINRYFRESEAEFIVLAADGSLISTYDQTASYSWCEDFLGLCQEPDVSMVGGFTWTSGARLKHCAFSLGSQNLRIDGYRISQHVTGLRAVFRSAREVSAMFPYFAMIRRQHFIETGGLDHQLPPILAWADLCMKFRAANLRIISTPNINTYHFASDIETASPDATDIQLPRDFKAKWFDSVKRDPYSVFRPEQRIHRHARWRP